MAQLGEWRRARELLKRAARAFGAGPDAALARARCAVAEAEVALANRDLEHDPPELKQALAVLDAQGDHANAALGRLTAARRWLLLGRSADAHGSLPKSIGAAPPAHLMAIAELVAADISSRQLDTTAARDALGRAQRAAQRAKIPALQREVQLAQGRLRAPVARLRSPDGERLVRLDEVAALYDSGKLVVDACRRELRAGAELVSLVDRPVLFELLWALSEAHPGSATRESLLWRAFGLRRSNESTRVRLRVEIGRFAQSDRAPSGRTRHARTGSSSQCAPAQSCTYSRLPPKVKPMRCSPCSVLENPGRPRTWPVRSARANAACNARSSPWRPRAKRFPREEAAPGAGSARRFRRSRQRCYSSRHGHRVKPRS